MALVVVSCQPAKFILRYAPPPGSPDSVHTRSCRGLGQLTECPSLSGFFLLFPCLWWVYVAWLQEVFIDAFSQGHFLTRTELQDILVHIVPDSTNPMYLRATRNSDVWARVLRNLINVYKERNLAMELCGAIALLVCQGPDGADSLAQRAIRMQV